MLREAFRTVRSWPSVNRTATAGVRRLSRLAHADPTPFVDHLPRLGPVRAPLPGGGTLRLVAEPAEAYANLVYWRGWDGPEPEMASVFWEHALAASVVLDVGAHVGYYSLLAGHARASASVIAFEPLPAVARRLRRHVDLNRLRNVDVREAAVGAAAGRAALWHTTAIPVPSSSGLDRAVLGPEASSSIDVEVTTIDVEVARRGVDRVDLIKIDTEGTEPDVLAGAREVIERARPRIFCEVLPSADTGMAIERLLGPLGYRWWLLTDAGPEERPAIEGHPRHRNWMFAAG